MLGQVEFVDMFALSIDSGFNRLALMTGSNSFLGIATKL